MSITVTPLDRSEQGTPSTDIVQVPSYERDERFETVERRQVSDVIRTEIAKIGPPELIEVALASGATSSVAPTLVGTKEIITALPASPSLTETIKNNVAEDGGIRAMTEDPEESERMTELPRDIRLDAAIVQTLIHNARFSEQDRIVLEQVTRVNQENQFTIFQWMEHAKSPTEKHAISMEGLKLFKDVLIGASKQRVGRMVRYRTIRRINAAISLGSTVPVPASPDRDQTPEKAPILPFRQRKERNPDLDTHVAEDRGSVLSRTA